MSMILLFHGPQRSRKVPTKGEVLPSAKEGQAEERFRSSLELAKGLCFGGGEEATREGSTNVVVDPVMPGQKEEVGVLPSRPTAVGRGAGSQVQEPCSGSPLRSHTVRPPLSSKVGEGMLGVPSREEALPEQLWDTQVNPCSASSGALDVQVPCEDKTEGASLQGDISPRSWGCQAAETPGAPGIDGVPQEHRAEETEERTTEYSLFLVCQAAEAPSAPGLDRTLQEPQADKVRKPPIPHAPFFQGEERRFATGGALPLRDPPSPLSSVAVVKGAFTRGFPAAVSLPETQVTLYGKEAGSLYEERELTAPTPKGAPPPSAAPQGRFFSTASMATLAPEEGSPFGGTPHLPPPELSVATLDPPTDLSSTIVPPARSSQGAKGGSPDPRGEGDASTVTSDAPPPKRVLPVMVPNGTPSPVTGALEHLTWEASATPHDPRSDAFPVAMVKGGSPGAVPSVEPAPYYEAGLAGVVKGGSTPMGERTVLLGATAGEIPSLSRVGFRSGSVSRSPSNKKGHSGERSPVVTKEVGKKGKGEQKETPTEEGVKVSPPARLEEGKRSQIRGETEAHVILKQSSQETKGVSTASTPLGRPVGTLESSVSPATVGGFPDAVPRERTQTVRELLERVQVVLERGRILQNGYEVKTTLPGVGRLSLRAHQKEGRLRASIEAESVQGRNELRGLLPKVREVVEEQLGQPLEIRIDLVETLEERVQQGSAHGGEWGGKSGEGQRQGNQGESPSHGRPGAGEGGKNGERGAQVASPQVSPVTKRHQSRIDTMC